MNPVLNSHINDFNNPHQVTADQVGAPSDQEFSNHVNNKTNPHQVTAVQAGALSVSGGTVNGAVTINGNLNLGNGEIIVNDGTMNVQAGGSINFQTPTLTQNGQPIGGGDIPIWTHQFFVSKSQSSVTLGPYSQRPKYILIIPGGFLPWLVNTEEGNNISSIALGFVKIPEDNNLCTGGYISFGNNGQTSTIQGQIGTISGNSIICTNTDTASRVFFAGNGNYYTTIAFF